MQEFEQYDPRKPRPDQRLLRVFRSPDKTDGDDFYFLKQEEHILIYSEKFHTYPETSDFKPGETELFADQIELPLPAIRWFIDVVEQKFFKPPEEGGLPANKLSYEESVAGEDLHVMRTMNADCPRPGYDITNASRRSHMAPDDLQEVAFSDPWLFDNGLMDFLKQLADDYERGNL